MSAIGLLAQIIAQRVKVASASLQTAPGFLQLKQHGYLRDAGVVSSLTCTDCDQDHDVEVVFNNGQYGYFCADLGFVTLGRSQIQAVRADIPRLINGLADAFECKRRKTSPVSDETWRIGAVDLGRGDATLFFHPCLRDEEDLRAFHVARSRETRSAWSLIITAEGALAALDATTIRLDHLVQLSEHNGALVPLSEIAVLLGIPMKNTGGAPNRYGARLTEIIESRIKNRQALTGFNKEAEAVWVKFSQDHPALEPPSLSSVKAYLRKIRGGQ